MSKWVLYIILLLSVLCFLAAGSSGKKIISQKNSIVIETKNQSSAGYGLDESVSSRDSSNDDSSIFNHSDLSSDNGSLSGNSVSGVDSGHFNIPETMSIPESAPTYTIQNIVTDVTCRGFPKSGILTAGDTIHYQINVTNNANCNLTNVTLTDPVVMSMRPDESVSEDGIMKPYETWTYTGSYIVSQDDLNINGNGSGIIENTATIDCDQFDPISSTATVPIKDGKVPYRVLSPGKSWTPSGISSASLDDTSNNGDSSIASATGAVYDQVSPQTSRVNTYIYKIIQPVSPPFKFHSSNTSYLGQSSHYVGADGHTITLVDNESAVDPSYEQLVEFIKKDKTNEIPYNNTSFVCSDAAERVHNNAEAIGFRSAWVYIDFANESATLNPATNALVVGHACNLFNTTDKGLVAIDCTGGSRPTDDTASIDLSKWDNEVSLIKSEEYTPRLLYSFPGSDKLKKFSSMGTIADFYVFW